MLPWVPEDIFFLSILMVGGVAASTRYQTVSTVYFILGILRTDLEPGQAGVEFYKLTTLEKMILLAVKLSWLDVSRTQLKRGFNFPFKFIYGQLVTRSRS